MQEIILYSVSQLNFLEFDPSGLNFINQRISQQGIQNLYRNFNLDYRSTLFIFNQDVLQYRYNFLLYGLTKCHVQQLRLHYQNPHLLEDIFHIQFTNLKTLALTANHIVSIQSIRYLNVPHLTDFQVTQNNITSIKPLIKVQWTQNLDMLILCTNRLTNCQNFNKHLLRMKLGKDQRNLKGQISTNKCLKIVRFEQQCQQIQDYDEDFSYKGQVQLQDLRHLCKISCNSIARMLISNRQKDSLYLLPYLNKQDYPNGRQMQGQQLQSIMRKRYTRVDQAKIIKNVLLKRFSTQLRKANIF